MECLRFFAEVQGCAARPPGDAQRWTPQPNTLAAQHPVFNTLICPFSFCLLGPPRPRAPGAARVSVSRVRLRRPANARSANGPRARGGLMGGLGHTLNIFTSHKHTRAGTAQMRPDSAQRTTSAAQLPACTPAMDCLWRTVQRRQPSIAPTPSRPHSSRAYAPACLAPAATG